MALLGHMEVLNKDSPKCFCKADDDNCKGFCLPGDELADCKDVVDQYAYFAKTFTDKYSALSRLMAHPVPKNMSLTLEKVEGYNPMLAALYVGFICSVLTAGLVGASFVYRDNFDVFTLTLPGMFEKTFQLAADIVTSLFIASLLLENEMNGCQVWNLSDTAVQCAIVSGLLYIYIVVVMAFVSSNRRLQHLTEEGGSTFKSFVGYAAM